MLMLEDVSLYVQVHSVVDEHSGLCVPDETHTEVFLIIGDTLHSYVKWPRQYVKLLNEDASSKSSGYMVIKHMKEFIDSIQHDLVNRLWNEQEHFEESQIENLVV
ncbi:hypothetical protein HanPI659440_Chr17g0675311 [Helianthus annuus]|nr:hypothetical protein HanPI659440_Chr17g0675311 [Helianthus annuus]